MPLRAFPEGRRRALIEKAVGGTIPSRTGLCSRPEAIERLFQGICG